MRVQHTVPGTWRARTHAQAALPDPHLRAVAVVRAVTDGLDEVWQRLRTRSVNIYTRLKKARSETQAPSALARVFEEILALHHEGASPERLQIYVTETALLVASLDGPQGVTAQRMLDVMHEANLAGAAEAVAESKLALRPDRELPLGGLEEHREKTRNALAALQQQLYCLDQQIAQRRAQPPMRVIRGGQA